MILLFLLNCGEKKINRKITAKPIKQKVVQPKSEKPKMLPVDTKLNKVKENPKEKTLTKEQNSEEQIIFAAMLSSDILQKLETIDIQSYQGPKGNDVLDRIIKISFEIKNSDIGEKIKQLLVEYTYVMEFRLNERLVTLEFNLTNELVECLAKLAVKEVFKYEIQPEVSNIISNIDGSFTEGTIDRAKKALIFRTNVTKLEEEEYNILLENLRYKLGSNIYITNKLTLRSGFVSNVSIIYFVPERLGDQ